MSCEIVVLLVLGIIFLQFLMKLHDEDFYHDENE